MKAERRTAVNMKGKRTDNVGFFAVPAAGPVCLDGCFDDWDLSGQIESYADSSLKDMFSVKTAAMWDKDYLYLAFDWRDPYPLKNSYNPLQDRSHGWNADSVQLRFLVQDRPIWLTTWCFEGDKSVGDMVYLHKRDEKGKSIGKEFDKLYYTGVSGQWELNDGFGQAYRMSDDGKGFTQEIRIPWRELYLEAHVAAPGQTIRLGLEFQFGRPSGWGFRLHNFTDNRQAQGGGGAFWGNFDGWGDLTLLDHSVQEKRIYREADVEADGTIPLRCQLPASAKTFTITLNSKDGKRIRNVAGGYRIKDYTVSEKDGVATVEVLWDGLDESGDLVDPGSYEIHGITSDGVEGYYESSFYNPGTPSWETEDGRGTWGSDHTAPHQIVAVGDYVAVASRFGECSFGSFLLNAVGEDADTKRWSEMRGTDAMAADDRCVYMIPNDWADSAKLFLRIDAASGRYVPYIVDGKEQQMPCQLASMLCEPKDVKVTAMAVQGGLLYMRCNDHSIRMIDIAKGAECGRYTLNVDDETDNNVASFGNYTEKPISAMAIAGNTLYYTALGRVFSLNLTSGDIQGADFAVEKPTDITIDREGYIYIADGGAAQQILKFRQDGKEILRVGKYGGRPREGKYEPDGLFNPTSIAVDVAGKVWVTEGGKTPRRISVWLPDGSYYKEFVGNAGYQAEGTFIHDDDPDKAFAEFCEMKRDRETGTWTVENLMYNPDYSRGWHIKPPHTHFDRGSMFYSAVSGEEREYYSGMGFCSGTLFFLMVKRDERWKPVAGITTVAELLGLYGGNHNSLLMRMPYGEWSDCDPADLLFWNDYNNDGELTRDECVIVPAMRKSVLDGISFPIARSVVEKAVRYECVHGAAISADDLSFFIMDRMNPAKIVTYLMKPTRYRDDQLPVYLPEGLQWFTSDYRLLTYGAFASAQFVKGKDLVIAFIQQEGQDYVAGLRKSDSQILWRYCTPYHGVQGSHGAPMPKSGLLIGCLKITGCVQECGDSDVFMIRGNCGEDYYITSDGMFVDTLGRDVRIPGVQLPEDEESLRKVSIAQFPGHCEHFSGRLARHTDGVVRSHGAVPSSTAGNIIRIEGLESIHHFAPVTVMISAEQLIDAERENQARALRVQKKKSPIKIRHESMVPDNEHYPAYEISKKGLNVQGWFQAAYDENNLHLSYRVQGLRWINGGKNMQLLFKTGACLDFQCSPTGNSAYEPAEGDFRLLIAPHQGKNIAVLMRQKEGKQQWDADHYKYTSPVAEVIFQKVCIIDEARIEITEDENGLCAEVFVPWDALGMIAPKPGDVLTGDAGFIVADALGQKNIARVYRNNPSTNLVSDQPNEARITANAFGQILF